MAHVVAFYVLLLLACSYALRHGGAPERWVAGFLLVGTLATWAIVIGPRGYGGMFRRPEPMVAAIDGVMLLCLIAIALLADRFWPLWLVALQAFGVVGHLVKEIAPEIVRDVYLTAHAFSAYPGLILLVAATRRHRLRLARRGSDPSWSASWPRSIPRWRRNAPPA